MNFIQRAIRYVKRKPSKSFLLTLTFFLIGNLVILGLGVSQAADNAKILTRKKMRAIVSYEVDYNAYWQYADSLTDADEMDAAYRNTPRIDRNTAVSLTDDPRVVAFNYMTTNVAYGRDLEHVPLGNEENRGGEDDYVEPNLMIYANLFPDMLEIHEGTYTITDGRWYTQNEIDDAAPVAVITEELADQNGLRVGDTFFLQLGSPNDFKSNKDAYTQAGITEDDIFTEVEIVGIYSTAEDVDPNAEGFRWMSPYESPKNRVQMPMTTMADMSVNAYNINVKVHPDWYDSNTVNDDEIREQAMSPGRVIYLLDDPLNVDAFVADNQSRLGEYTMLNANNETFKKMARPLDTMSFFANIVVWIVVVNAIVIISLVTALTLKTREYEIGVLLSIGVSKVKIVLQLFLELIIVAFIGFTLASISGSLMAGSVGDMVLDFQTSSDAQYETDEGYSFINSTDYFTSVTQDDLLSEYHVSVSPLLIAEIFILGTGVVLIAIVIPSFMIMRLNPKQILLEQN